MSNGRTRLRARIAGGAALALIATLVPTTLVPFAGHADPRPTLAEVRGRVDALEHEAEAAAERFNEARESLAAARRSLASADRNVERQQARLAAMTRSMGGYAATLYRQGGLDPTLQALMADNPDDFLAGTTLAEAYSAQQVAALRAIAAERQVLAEREADAAAKLRAVDAFKDAAAAEKSAIDAKVRESSELLQSLEAEERARLEREERLARERAAAAARQASRSLRRAEPPAEQPSTDGSSGAAPATSAPASGRARIAVDFALAQVGKQYVYGGSGPDVYDCSGLTMVAWGRAGVSLPHTVRGQMAAGTYISVSQLQPGDLIAYYSPIQHVGMYIGNGNIVHAANPRTDVNIAPLRSMPITQAFRVG